MQNEVADVGPVVSGPVNQILGSASASSWSCPARSWRAARPRARRCRAGAGRGAQAKGFITTVGGRAQAYADVLGSVLLPDMLIVQTDKDPATAAWLNWVGLSPLADGWGGRKLQDDVVDLALLAVFGDPFGADPAGAMGKEALTSDNVGFDSPGITSTFPYLAPPN